MAGVYNDDYAPKYQALYIDHPLWRDKNDFNLKVLGGLLRDDSRWLDTCCGQGWQLARFANVAERVGVDISESQLEVAREAAPGVEFHCADILSWEPGQRRFDVCSNFWGALSYLGDLASLELAIDRLIRWTAPGGSIVLELITPSLLEAFNFTPFARDNHCQVITEEGTWRWGYIDPGGRHELISPPVDFYAERLRPHFRSVEHVATITAMAQLVARERKEP